MKTPQIEDYATSAGALKKYSLEDMPPIQPRGKRGSSPAASNEAQPVKETDTRTGEYPNGRTGERASAGRVIKRYSFELYEDQMKTLRRLSAEERLNGEKGSMSEMVREAIAAYVATRKGK